MVNKPKAPDAISEKLSHSKPAKGRLKKGRPILEIQFNQTLFTKIQSEAKERGWSMSRMVRFLCDAAIDGIE